MNESTSRDGILSEFENAGRAKAAPAGSDVQFDAEQYLPELEDTDLTEDQKRELLQALWSIMKGFVDLGFGVNSIHRFFPEIAAEPSESGAGELDSKSETRMGKFEEAADTSGAKEGPS